MTHHYYICRGSVLTKIQILCHFKKLLRLKKHICHLVTIPTMWAVGLLLSDRGAVAWYGFTMCPVGLLLLIPGAVAWYGFTMCPVGLLLLIPGAAAWYGFTMCPVGLLLLIPGAAWCGFTMWAVVASAVRSWCCLVWLHHVPCGASAADPRCFLNKQAQPRKRNCAHLG